MLEPVERDEFMRVFDCVGLRIHPELGNFAFAPTGELYWMVCCQGIVPIGQGRLLGYATKNTAIREFNQAVRKLMDEIFDRCPAPELFTVYFRQYPHFVEVDGGYNVKSRFLISCGRMIYPADYNEIEGVKYGCKRGETLEDEQKNAG